MKPAPFVLSRPRTLEEALEVLATRADAKVLAGGQSLIPLLSMRLAAPSTLVDITAVPGLDRVETDERGVRVGAMARHSRVLADAEANRVQPLLGRALRMVAHATIRNAGTTVGSVVHADPAAELPMVLALLGGSVDTVSRRGGRTIPAEDLFVGALETSLRSDELAVEAWFPALPHDGGCAFDEVARRNGDYAVCGVGATVRTDADGRLTAARVGYVSMADVPAVVDVLDLDGGGDASDVEPAVDRAVEWARDHLDPVADVHASADYRHHLAGVLTARVLRAAVEDAVTRREAARP